MKVRPILMSGPMVRAIIAGRKGQTRRLRWRPADILWVREKHSLLEGYFAPTDEPGWEWTKLPVPESGVWYWADGEPQRGDWTMPRPSIHMPRWASRITLEVTATKVERLQDISEEDAKAEGVHPAFEDDFGEVRSTPFYRWGFRQTWDTLHGAGAWASNPEVVAITFRPHLQNVDAFLERSAA